MAIEWKSDADPSPAEAFSFGVAWGKEYGHVSQYGTGASCAGKWCWQVTVGDVKAVGVVATRLDAERAIDLALPILREADARLTEELQDREAVRAVVGAVS